MATFRKYTWFESPKSKRLFLIVEIWWKAVGEIGSIHLLERGETKPVVLEETELEKLVKEGELTEVVPKEEPNPYSVRK